MVRQVFPFDFVTFTDSLEGMSADRVAAIDHRFDDLERGDSEVAGFRRSFRQALLDRSE